MKKAIRISDDEFFKFRHKIKSYSVKELKKINLNYYNTSSGAELLHTSMYQPELLKKLVQAGININHKDDHGFNAAYHISICDTPYENLKFLIENGIDISNNSEHNLLHHLSRQYTVYSKEEEDTLSKIQLLLISKNRNLIHIEGGYGLSLLTPDTLRYLKNYQNIDIFNIKYPAGENVLFEIIHSDLYKTSYAEDMMLPRLLNLMNINEINHISYRHKNVAFYCNDIEQVHLLKKYGLNFSHTDNKGQGLLELNEQSSEITEAFIEYGAKLAQKTYIDIATMDKNEFINLYNWRESYYDIIKPLGLQQYASYEKECVKQNLETVKPLANKSFSRI